MLTHPLMAALLVEHLKVLISRAPKGPYGRAPKGSIYLLGGPSQISQKKGLLPHPLLSLMVEPPKG